MLSSVPSMIEYSPAKSPPETYIVEGDEAVGVVSAFKTAFSLSNVPPFIFIVPPELKIYAP